MDRPMDGRTDGPMDGRTGPLIEMLGASKNAYQAHQVANNVLDLLNILASKYHSLKCQQTNFPTDKPSHRQPKQRAYIFVVHSNVLTCFSQDTASK